MPLTDAQCRNAKCPSNTARLRMADGQGMYLEVVPGGGKYWRLKYRIGGREKRLSVGVYPAVSLAMARQARTAPARFWPKGSTHRRAPGKQGERRHHRRQHVRGCRPRLACAVEGGPHGSPRDYAMRRLQADVFPDLGPKPIADITAPMLVRVAKKIEARGALDIAKRSLQTCGQILRYAVAHGFISRNPASDIKPADVLTSRTGTRTRTNYARLEAKELPKLLRRMAG